MPIITCAVCGQEKHRYLSEMSPGPKFCSPRCVKEDRGRWRKIPLTASRLRELIEYDGETGIFMWREARIGWKFSHLVAGGAVTGYLKIKIDDRLHGASRLAWLYVYGEWPPAFIDHIDGNPLNNKWNNLRLATRTENTRNRKRPTTNTSGYKGVTFRRGRWWARIGVDGRRIHLGYYDRAADAAAAYNQAAFKYHGEFARAA